MRSLWEKIEKHYPVYINMERVSFDAIRHEMKKFLVSCNVHPYAFSHFGLVVNSIETSIEALNKICRMSSNNLKRNWVEAYNVHVARRILGDGNELELIEPAGESFLNSFLKEHGEGLHHLAFLVNNIQNCLKKLKTEGVELIDKEPRSGSHGKVAFLLPGLFGQMYIELCQKDNKKNKRYYDIGT